MELANLILSFLLVSFTHQDEHTVESSDKNTAYELTKSFSVSPEKLYKAFIDETILKRIWGVSSITVDARPGGQADAKMEINGENWNFTITYREVVLNEKLKWIVHFQRFPKKETRVTLHFKKTAGGSDLTMIQENFENVQERDENRKAWESALATLMELVK